MSNRNIGMELEPKGATASASVEKVAAINQSENVARTVDSLREPNKEVTEKYMKKIIVGYTPREVQGNEMKSVNSLQVLSEREECLLTDFKQKTKGAPQGTSKDSEIKKSVGNHVRFHKIQPASSSSVITSVVSDHSTQFHDGKAKNLGLKKQHKPRKTFLSSFTKCCCYGVEDEDEDDEDLQ